MKNINLNLTKESAKAFIDWLANDGYWGHTLTAYDINHGKEITNFIINGHKLSNYSNLINHVIIDDCYCETKNGRIVVNNKEYLPIEYCLMKLGFEKGDKHMLFTADRETGTFIDKVDSVYDGLKLIKFYEDRDMADETYEPNFYDIVDENHCSIDY